MRIVAGRHRGRPLAAPPGRDIRPTADRAREGLFNILEHGRFAVELDMPIAGARVLDAFAGTGALGLEALSRGAEHATFIENGRAARAALARNIAACGEADRTAVINADATDPPAADRPRDIVFLDPPYGKDLATPALQALDRRGWIGARALIVVEIGAGEAFAAPGFLREHDRRRYGAAQIIFLGRRAAPQ